jgi:nicotinamidase-related amidase
MPAEDPEELAPDDARTVLLLVDVLNALEFDGAEALLERAIEMAEQIAALKSACHDAGIPTIYANDNFGRWRSNIDQLIECFLSGQVRGRPLIERLMPAEHDYRILKPMHSAFYAAPLNLLLRRLGAENLIIAGLSTDRCVTFTANDAYMRQYRLYVPGDCCAAENDRDHRESLEMLARVIEADVSPWRSLDLGALAGRT